MLCELLTKVNDRFLSPPSSINLVTLIALHIRHFQNHHLHLDGGPVSRDFSEKLRLTGRYLV